MSARTSSRKASASPGQRSLAFKRPSLSERRRQQRTMFVGAAAVAILVLVGLGLYALHLPEVTIQTVTVTGTHYADAGVVEGAVRGALNGAYALVIPKDSIVLYPQQAVEVAIVALPVVASVKISRTSLTSLSVAVTERTPVARWCTSVGGDCYLMDESGFIFMPVGTETLTIYTGGLSGAPPGQTYLGGAFATLQSFVERLPTATGRTVSAVSIDDVHDIFISFDGGGELRLALKSLLGNQANDMLLANVGSVFTSSKFKKGMPFSYVDFRFGTNVYVKWK